LAAGFRAPGGRRRRHGRGTEAAAVVAQKAAIGEVVVAGRVGPALPQGRAVEGREGGHHQERTEKQPKENCDCKNTAFFQDQKFECL